MKKINFYLSIVALGVAAVSCSNLNNNPVFDDANAFVEFGKTTLSVSEDGKSVSIPVTLASLKGLSENVSYEAVDGTAKAGTNFELADGSATLKFDSENRSQNIVINIKDNPGVYTGDLKFTVAIKNAGSLGIGMNSKCTITITDNDHPLASILGAYTATDKSYGKADQSWTLNMSKDPDDVTVVHIDALIKFCAGSSKYDVTGTVSEDLKTITIANGQKTKDYDASATDFMSLLTWTDGIYVDTTTDIVMTQVEPGVWTCPSNIGFWGCESHTLYSNTIDRGPLTLKKQ